MNSRRLVMRFFQSCDWLIWTHCTYPCSWCHPVLSYICICLYETDTNTWLNQSGDGQKTENRPQAAGLTRCKRLLVARHFAFNALDVEVQATQKLVIGHRILGQLNLAAVVGNRALPDDEAAVKQAEMLKHHADARKMKSGGCQVDTMCMSVPQDANQVLPPLNASQRAKATRVNQIQ